MGLRNGTHVSAVSPTTSPSSNPSTPLQNQVAALGLPAGRLLAKTENTPIPEPLEEDLQPAKQIHWSSSIAAQLPTDGFEAIICSKAWPCAEAVAVARCESGLDRHGRLDGNWATNGRNFGLFQINSVHADKWPGFYQDWMDPVKNTEWAFEIWSKSGWGPWECQPRLSSGQMIADHTGAPTSSDLPENATIPAVPTDTLATDIPTDTPPPDISPTPTDVASASPTQTPPAFVLPTRTPRPSSR